MTRLFFNSTLSVVSDLPTTEQSSLTAAKSVDALTVNRTLSQAVGSGQTTLVMASLAQTAQQNLYFSRFVSDPLDMPSLAAQTWVYNFATIQSSTSGNFPTSSSALPVHVCCYVWRPSTLSIVGNLIDGNGSSDYAEIAANAERVGTGTFAGAAVNSMADGDVLVFEVWFRITQAAAASYTFQFCYNGTVITTVKNNNVTNHASFIESLTSTLIFSTGSSPITATSDYKDLKKPITVTRI
jgi:hypothetical protein